MMNRWTLVLGFIFLGSALWANDLKFEILRNKELSSNPGKVNTFVFIIKNTGSKTIHTSTTFEFPEEWKSFEQQKNITLESGQQVKELMSFVVPPKALKGKYPIQYSVSSQGTRQAILQGDFSFTIKATNKIDVRGLETAPMVMAGSTTKGIFLVKNLSNQTQKIQLTSIQGTVKGRNTINLDPFSNKMVEVEAKIFEAFKQETNFSFNLEASILGGEIIANDYLRTKVTPNKEFEQKHLRTLPGYASLSYITRTQNNRTMDGWQGNLYMAGNIDKNNEKHIELSLRGPDQRGESDILLYDEYYAIYKDTKIQAKIGDHNYSLTRLTEFARNGRGVALNYAFKEHEVGGFVTIPRFFPDIKREYALYFTNHFNENNSISFNYLEKEYASDRGNASLLSISGEFLPFKNTFINAEISAGQGEGREGHAAQIALGTELFKKVRFDSEFILASPEYDGYYQNTTNFTGNINWTITNKINLFANFFQNDRNAALDTLYQFAPLSERKQVGLRYNLTRTLNFQVDARQYSLEDRLPQKVFSRKERLVAARLTNRLEKFGWSFQSEYGKYDNLLRTLETDLQTLFRASLNLNFKFGSTYLDLFSNYYSESSLLYDEQKQLLFGVVLNTRFAPSNNLRIHYQNNYAIEEYYRNRNTFGLSFKQKLWNAHQFEVEVRQLLRRNTLDQKDFSMALKYIWNFNIPIEKGLPKGSVKGRIFRKGLAPAKGIILYMNGHSTITDEFGRFEFKKVQAGIYPINIDKSTLELHELPEREGKYFVEVMPEKEKKIDIHLIKTGKLSGQILLKNNAPEPFLIKQLTFNHYLVKMEKDGEIRRTSTDVDGRFKFKDLRPGKWKLTILNMGQNKRILIDKTQYEIEIVSGKKSYLPIVAKQKKRNIQFKKIINLSDDDDD